MNNKEKNDSNGHNSKIKSVIIDSELKEWEEWGNKYFGNGEHGYDTFIKDDLKSNKKRK